MDIQNVNHLSLHRIESYRQGTINESSKLEVGTSGERAEVQPGDVRDSVELSAVARVNATSEPEGIEFARKALLGVPPLNQDRIMEIVSRIQDGYYLKSDVMSQISDRIAEEISGQDAPSSVESL